MDSMRSLLSTSDFLQVREHKLSNDLTVWLNEDHSQPKIFGAVVVKKFEDVSPNEKRLDLCRDYGLIYYYRTGEKRKEEVNK